MEQIDGIIGNINADESLAGRIQEHDSAGTLQWVTIAAADRHRSRLRVETDEGSDLGLVPDRELRSGDVLVLEPERAVVVEFESREAAIIPLPEPTPHSLARMSELGHRIGNQHWDLAIHDGALYVPVAADRHILEDVLEPHLPPGTEISYADVDPGLWIDTDIPPEKEGHSGDGHDHSYANHDHRHADQDHGSGDHDHSYGQQGHTNSGRTHAQTKGEDTDAANHDRERERDDRTTDE